MLNTHSIETTSEVNSRRLSLSPKKSNTQFLLSEVSKLEEELDADEINLKLYEIRELSDDKKFIAEAEIYEKYIDGMIKIISQTDQRLSNSLSRGWKGYRKTMKTKEVFMKSRKISEQECIIKEFASQVNEDLLGITKEVNVDDYILSLHKVMKGMNQMNIGKIMHKLSELNTRLKPIDVPSPSSSPELEELDFTDTIKAIHTKLKAAITPKSKIQKNEGKAFRAEATQTFVKNDDFKVYETMKNMLSEKDQQLAEVHNKLREKEETEELLLMKSRECDELKKSIFEMQTTICPQCQTKKKKLEADQVEIKALQLTVYKSITIEKELEQTKNKLKDTLGVVSIKNNRIIELADNLEDMKKKVEEILAQKEELQRLLLSEEKEKILMEDQLQKELDKNTQLKKIITSRAVIQQQNLLNPDYDFQPSSRAPTKTPQDHDKVFTISPDKKRAGSPLASKRHFEKFTSNTPSDTFHEIPSSISPTKRKVRLHEVFINRVESSKVETPERKRQKVELHILRSLNMTKEEYLALSNKQRVELYEALYEHKEKCGADCEHLKRAMMIRYKNRGILFPTKKYNIS